MDRFVADIMPQLGLKNPKARYRPHGSRDELDFLCHDVDGRAVVVEMKKEDGERKAVEQVLRYIRLIRDLAEWKEPRGLVLTGHADLHTRRALEELEPHYQIDWFVYGLDAFDNIRVEKVAIRALQR